jgi:DNA-binding response OmpR family regulator
MKPHNPNSISSRAEGTAPVAPPAVVLLVEDDRPLLELFTRFLQADQLRVLTAANGHDALAVLEKSRPDLVVTDVAMPRLDGFGLMRRLRRLYPDIPVIVISGDDWYTDRPVAAVAAELGAVATLIKPFDLAVLHEAVWSVLPGNGEARRRERLSA